MTAPRFRRRTQGALATALAAGMTVGSGCAAGAAPRAQSAPPPVATRAPGAAAILTPGAAGGMTVFGPDEAPFDVAGRRSLARDTLLWFWDWGGLFPGRGVYLLPKAPTLGTKETPFTRPRQITVPGSVPVYLMAFTRVDRTSDPGAVAVLVDGKALGGLGAYLYGGVRAPEALRLYDHEVLDLVFAPPPAGTHVVEVRWGDAYTLRYELQVQEADSLGPLLLRGPQGKVYALHGPTRRALPDGETAAALGYAPEAILAAAPGALGRLAEGPALPALRPGDVVQGDGEPLFRLQEGARRWLRDGDELAAAVDAAGGGIQRVDPPALRAVPPVAGPGALLTSTAGDVYYVDGGALRRVPDWAWIERRGLDGGQLLRVPERGLSRLPTGAPEAQPAGPVRQDDTFRSAALGTALPYRILYPPGYLDVRDGEAGRRYPVLYLLHGLSGRYDEWTEYDLEAAARDVFGEPGQGAAVTPSLIVLPQGANGYWANQQGGEAWGDYVARDLVAHVDATYRTLPRREARAVGGLSMGGHGALCLTLTYPDVFGVAGAHTPSLHSEQTGPGFFAGAFARYDPTSLVQDSRIERPPRLWIDAVKNDADAWLPLAERLHGALERKGWAHEWQVNPGGHNPAYWKGHVRDYLRFYLRAFVAGGAGAVVPGATPGATPGGSVSSAP